MIGLNKKTAPLDSPQAVFASQGWTWKVLKSWQNDDNKPYARWFVAVRSPMTYGSFDMGDTYVRDIVLNAHLIEVDGREPTVEELDEVDQLRHKLAAQKDPLADLFA
jgi:hypothetical protein